MGSCIRNLRLFHTMTLKSVFFGQFEAPPRVICANVIRNPEAERLGEPRNSLSPGRLRSTMSRRTSQITFMSVLLGHSDRGWLLGPYESCQIARNPSISARTIASILSYSLQRFRVRSRQDGQTLKRLIDIQRLGSSMPSSHRHERSDAARS